MRPVSMWGVQPAHFMADMGVQPPDLWEERERAVMQRERERFLGEWERDAR